MKQFLLQPTYIKFKQPFLAALLIACCTFFIIPKSMAQQAGVFYTVTGNGLKDTSYLFGTYHLIKSSYLENKTAVQHAFNKAKGIVVETIIDSSQLMAANAKGLLQKKELKGLLGNHFADTLDAELKGSIGAGLDQFNSLKPMTVMITLSLVQLMKDNAAVMNGYSGSALDVSFAENGKAAGKIITPLETIFEQMDFLFNSLSDEQQAEYLKLFIRNKSENTKMGNELLQAYLDNDLAAMHRVYEKGINISGDMEFLVTGRNNNWMKVLPGLMKNQSQFIAVGALHLCGKTGLVDQLQQMGFKVTAINL